MYVCESRQLNCDDEATKHAVYAVRSCMCDLNRMCIYVCVSAYGVRVHVCVCESRQLTVLTTTTTHPAANNSHRYRPAPMYSMPQST